MNEESDFFQVGGTLFDDAPCYIERQADKDLLEFLKKGDLCLVLAPRQTGKSSLAIHAREKLKNFNIKWAIVDFQHLGADQNIDSLFNAVVEQISQTLELQTAALEWWYDKRHMVATQRFITFIEQVVLSEIKTQVTIFFDEIDTLLGLSFSDSFFTTIRSLFNARAHNLILRRLSFVLVGVASPSEFIKSGNGTPFNVGIEIELPDFNTKSLFRFKKILGSNSKSIINRIMDWTSGQPLLVQEIAKKVCLYPENERTSNLVDSVVSDTYLKPQIESNSHLSFIHYYLIRDKKNIDKILPVYNSILHDDLIKYDEKSHIHKRLLLSGVVKKQNERLVLRNRIYQNVFDENWIKKNKPTNLTVYGISKDTRKIRFLHISDLHIAQIVKDDPFESFNQGLENRSMIETIKDLGIEVDLIFITGNIARHGKPEEYQVAKIFCEKLIEATGIEQHQLLIVPGNNDADLKYLKPFHIKTLYHFENQEEIAERLTDNDILNALMRKFSSFSSFANKTMDHDFFDESKYNFSLTMDLYKGIHRHRFNLIGLNSCLFSGHKDTEEQKLALGLCQVNAALESLESSSLSMGFFNHPFRFFHSIDEPCKDLLCKKLDIILTGHFNTPSNALVYDSNGPAVIISSGNILKNRSQCNVFNVVEIDLKTGKGTAQYYNYIPNNKYWNRYKAINPVNEDGAISFTIDRLGFSQTFVVGLSSEYELIIETDEKNFIADFCLLSPKSIQNRNHQVKLPDHRLSFWEGLFDTRNYINQFAGNMILEGHDKPATKEQLLVRLGIFLGQEVLGANIMKELSRSKTRRALLVKLPETYKSPLAAAFARVPWEIARLSENDNSLMHQNLIVRMITEDTAQPDGLVLDEARRVSTGKTPLKVLLVFAETPDSRPLAMRLERERLRSLFYKDIMPQNYIQVDFLCHGLTREALRNQIAAAGGYHILHWSGHGHHNVLDLQGQEGEKDFITGKELVELFEDAGGFIPQLVFLSTNFSGTFIDIASWVDPKSFQTSEKSSEKKGKGKFLSKILEEETGYTGTALNLLRSGIPQVVAMRFEVGDDYARELAICFYRRLLADVGKHSTDSALTLARSDLLKDPAEAARLGTMNHATPLMFGQSGRLLDPIAKRGEQMDKIHPQPQPLLPFGNRELDPLEDFTGRSQELTELNMKWVNPGGSAVALIQGLAGMGKTALASEVIHLWHHRFDWVLAFQAKPFALKVDEFFKIMDMRLAMISLDYRKKCDSFPYRKIFLESNQDLSQENRYEQMRINLVEALQAEAIFIIFDNFENNLESFTVTGRDGFACREPEWEVILNTLAEEITGTRSRILVTSRHLPAALDSKDKVLWIQVGPLSLMEASLFIKSHPMLSRFIHNDTGIPAWLNRLLSVSRGHPLIMNRLAALANSPDAMTQILERLESAGFRDLPDIFADQISEAERKIEQAYLEDVAMGALDFLIERLSQDARRLLWIVTQANEPVTVKLVRDVWAGKSVENEQLGELSKLLKLVGMTPELKENEELQNLLSQIPPELWEKLEDASEAPNVPDIAPLLDELRVADLVTQGEDAYSFHELVKERVSEWMKTHPSETRGLTCEAIWVAYGERYAAEFESLQVSGQERAMEAASEAGRRALIYIVRAGAYEKLGPFASSFITSTNNPILLRSVITELEAVASYVPPGEERWSLRTYLADALRLSGQPDKSLAFYEQAAIEAEAAENWADVGTITGNWANALGDVGLLDKAKETHLKSVKAEEKAGRPKVHRIGSELEAFRIDVYQGKAKQVLPEIESKLDQVREWWQQSKNGNTIKDAPEGEFLYRVLIAGLNVAGDANRQLENWDVCLSLQEEIEQIQRKSGQSRHIQFRTRFNQYAPLKKMGRLDESRKILEECLVVFQEVDDQAGQSGVLIALADFWDEQGDLKQAMALARQALTIRNRLPDPEGRAISHVNLSNYYEKIGQNEETVRHDLTAGIYFLVSGRGDHLKTWTRNLSIRLNRANESNTTYTFPRVSGLIALPEFDALNRFLIQYQVDVVELQGQVDAMVEMVSGSTESPGSFLDAMPISMKQALEKLIEAAASGADIEPFVTELRNQLCQAAPGKENEIDEILDQLVLEIQK